MKTANLIKKWVPLSSTNILCLPTKYEINGTSKSPIFELFSDLESVTYAYIQKTYFLIFFMNWEKSRSAARVTFKNPKISLLIGKNLQFQSKTNTQESQFGIYGGIGKIYILI